MSSSCDRSSRCPSLHPARACHLVSYCPSSGGLGSRGGSCSQSVLRTWHDTDEMSSKHLSSDWLLALWTPEQRTVPEENVKNFFSNVAIWNINLITLRPCGSAPRLGVFLMEEDPQVQTLSYWTLVVKPVIKVIVQAKASAIMVTWKSTRKSTWWLREPSGVSILLSAVVWMTDSSQ